MGEVRQLSEALGANLSAPSAISKVHDISRFNCGKPPLDDWLRQRALKSEGNTARTYVVCNGNSVVGYYSMATGSIARTSMPPALRRNTPEHVPVIILARLAVDARCKKQGIGKGLLKEALTRSLQVAEIVGVRAMLVHAIDQDAGEFYKKYGFIDFPDGSQTLFLPIDSIRKLFD